MTRSVSPTRWAARTGLAILSVGALAAGMLAGSAPALAASSNVAPSCATPARAGFMTCFALRRTDLVSALTLSPNAVPSGFGPPDLQSAYKLPSNGGSGTTVAIVDAYNDPNAESDLAVYRTQYGLPACTTANGCFSKVSQTGSTTSLPTSDPDWSGEISLDVDMVSAIAPAAHILLVEATSPSDANLYAAVDYAAAHAKYVSNSWGGPEYSGQTTDDSHFNHPGVAITVSSGDDGNGAEYPATSRYVTAVGGTSLTRATSTTRGWTETVWNGAGSGCSAYDTKPTWQTVTTNCTRRAEADVSAVANPNTGVAVYQTYGATGWSVYGGTSASAPQIAAVYALAGTPASGTTPAQYPYAHPSNLFDVTSGNNGSCGSPQCTAGTGWDGPTGLGTPNGSAAFASGTGGGGNTVTVTNPGSRTGTVGTSLSLQISATDSGGAALTYSASGLPSGLSISGSGLISGTPTAAGSYSVTVTASDSTGASGSTTFAWTISGGGGTGCTSPGQKLGNPGFETGTAAPWTASSGVVDSSTGEPAHAGSWKAWLNGYGTTHTDTLTQSVAIPAGCTSYTLSFFLHIDTSETSTATQYDKLTVKAGTTTLVTYSNLDKGTGYTQRSVNLASFAGQTVSLSFTGTEDSSLQTSFVIDDAAVTVS